MKWLERLERKLRWLAFPGLLKYLTFLTLVAFACRWARPDIGALLDFDRDKILHGEVWRLFSYTIATGGMMPFTGWSAFILFIVMNLAIFISDSMEGYWDSTRVTLYLLLSWLAQTAAMMILGDAFLGGSLIFASIFCAFATYFPREELRIFMIVPVQVRVIALIGAGITALAAFHEPFILLFIAPAFAPYLLWVLPDLIRGTAMLAGSAVRRSRFNRAQLPETEVFHRCQVCGRTDQTDRYLHFYTLPDGAEYCEDHVPSTPGRK